MAAMLRSPTLLLLAALLLVAAACGGDTAPADEAGAGDQAAGDAAGGEAGGEAVGGQAVASGDLTVVHTWTGSEGEAFQAVIDGFAEASPDVNVELVQIPFGELNAQLTQQFATGSAPDVTVALPGLIRLFGSQDFLMPLDPLWDEWVDQGLYNESLRAIASADGTAYGAWFKGNVNALIWYKPDKLEDVGVEVPESWDDWTAGLDTAKQQGVDPFAVGGADQWPLTQWWDPFLLRVGGVEAFNGLVDGSVGWDDPRVVESFEAFGAFIADYFPETTLDRGFIEATCAWADGEALYQNQGAFINLVAPGECDETLQPGEDFTFFLMPKFDESAEEVQFISGDLFVVNAESPNPDGALALVRYLASADAQSIWAERGGYVAPNAEVPLNVYPNANDRKAAELWPREPGDLAGYDLDDSIGGQIQEALRGALQQFVRDQDVDAIVNTMVEVDQQVRGG